MPHQIAVSSWSLHRTIGLTYHDSPATGPKGEAKHSAHTLPLLELPMALIKHGYSAMQLCHFHLPSRDRAYAAEFRSALGDAGVELLTLLIDEGDITDPDLGEASVEWIQSWILTAAELGASRTRVIAGKQPYSPEAMDIAVMRMKAIAKTARDSGTRIETENWFSLLATPAAVNELLDRMEGELGLCADFGNWPRPAMYEKLPEIMGRAETCHAKFEFVSPSDLDEPHGQACIGIARDAGFSGPFVLVNGGIGDSDWDAMAIQRRFLSDAWTLF